MVVTENGADFIVTQAVREEEENEKSRRKKKRRCNSVLKANVAPLLHNEALP